MEEEPSGRKDTDEKSINGAIGILLAILLVVFGAFILKGWRIHLKCVSETLQTYTTFKGFCTEFDEIAEAMLDGTPTAFWLIQPSGTKVLVQLFDQIPYPILYGSTHKTLTSGKVIRAYDVSPEKKQWVLFRIPRPSERSWTTTPSSTANDRWIYEIHLHPPKPDVPSAHR